MMNNNWFDLINESGRNNENKKLLDKINELQNQISSLIIRVGTLENEKKIKEQRKILEKAEKATPEPCYFCKSEQAKPIFKFAISFIFLCSECIKKWSQLRNWEPISHEYF